MSEFAHLEEALTAPKFFFPHGLPQLVFVHLRGSSVVASFGQGNRSRLLLDRIVPASDLLFSHVSVEIAHYCLDWRARAVSFTVSELLFRQVNSTLSQRFLQPHTVSVVLPERVLRISRDCLAANGLPVEFLEVLIRHSLPALVVDLPLRHHYAS